MIHFEITTHSLQCAEETVLEQDLDSEQTLVRFMPNIATNTPFIFHSNACLRRMETGRDA